MHASRLAFRCLLLAVFILAPFCLAQRTWSGAAETKQALDRLNVLGSVLMVAAHPDDENNALLVYLGRGKKYRTSYLAVTRGEGGQNLIGPEQGDEIGLIRTQELLGARRWDAGEQYFTRAIDFGFSKSADESMQKWGKEQVLGDIVYNIRRYRPDVIINRFSGTPRDGHGHHIASGLLTKEAYEAAADPKRFPEQLRYVQPWRAKRIVFNMFAFNRQMEEQNAKDPTPKVTMEVGGYDPVLGFSYGEIAGMSRSSHKSQAFGSAERRGPISAQLVTIGGEPAKQDLFDGVDTTWNRVPGGKAIGDLIREATAKFQMENPAAALPALLAARQLAAKNTDWWAQFKLPEIDEAIALCAGLNAEIVTDREQATPKSALKLTMNVIQRLPYGLRWTGVRYEGAPELSAKVPSSDTLPVNRIVSASAEWTVPAGQPISQPYWMREPKENPSLFRVSDMKLLGLSENPPVLAAVFEFADGEGRTFELKREARYRFVDPVDGERSHRLMIVPPVALKIADGVMLYPTAAAKNVVVEVKANLANAAGKLKLQLPEGWSATPAEHAFSIANRGDLASFTFSVKPPAWPGKATLQAMATMADGTTTGVGTEVVKYPHIPPQTHFPPATASLVRADVKISSRRIGYVMGAGDEMPASIRQLGVTVDLLSADDLASGDLAKYDAIVTGVRAAATRPDLRASKARLMDYVSRGGTMIVQYNTAGGGPGGGSPVPFSLAPYPLKLSSARVTVEDAPVRFVDPAHPLLTTPNKITGEDFSGWIQERGLYFVTEFDAQYKPLFAMNDPGEKEHLGSTVVAQHGKGTYIYTSLAWFRELPAGVPGAYRIFANFLSGGK